MTHF